MHWIVHRQLGRPVFLNILREYMRSFWLFYDVTRPFRVAWTIQRWRIRWGILFFKLLKYQASQPIDLKSFPCFCSIWSKLRTWLTSFFWVMEGEDGRVATDERRHSLGLSIVTSINFERVYAAHVHSSPLSMPIYYGQTM